MKQIIFFLIAIIFSLNSIGQTVFFTSSKIFSEDQLQKFYASISFQDDLLLFNAPDYHLYAFNINNGALNWEYNLQRKSDIPPFFVEQFIWANGNEGAVKLDRTTGELLKELDIESVETKPYIKNGILYATGIYNAGSLFAYHLAKDTVLWHRFLAHGCSVEPYYLEDKIVANGEGEKWLDISYSGSIAAGCEIEEGMFPENHPCIKEYLALTHNKKEIKGKLAEKLKGEEYHEPIFYHAPEHTLSLNDDKLYVIGKKTKIVSETSLFTFSESFENVIESEPNILKADNEIAWILFNDHLIIYNYIKMKLVKIIDLKRWIPHQVLLDQDRVWLISKKDGLLYGINID